MAGPAAPAPAADPRSPRSRWARRPAGGFPDRLEHNPQETDLLFKELLGGVSSFFRDSALWTKLREEVLPALISRHAGEPRLRPWVAGSSTGEVAYSLAIVFREALDNLPQLGGATLQIFASDLNPDGIAQARRGRYPATIAADVSPARLQRFFVAQDGGYRVAAAIREMVLFDVRAVDITLRAFGGPGALAGMVLVVFRDTPHPPVPRSARVPARKCRRCARKCWPPRKNCARPTKSCNRPTRS